MQIVLEQLKAAKLLMKLRNPKKENVRSKGKEYKRIEEEKNVTKILRMQFIAIRTYRLKLEYFLK